MGYTLTRAREPGSWIRVMLMQKDRLLTRLSLVCVWFKWEIKWRESAVKSISPAAAVRFWFRFYLSSKPISISMNCQAGRIKRRVDNCSASDSRWLFRTRESEVDIQSFPIRFSRQASVLIGHKPKTKEVECNTRNVKQRAPLLDYPSFPFSTFWLQTSLRRMAVAIYFGEIVCSQNPSSLLYCLCLYSLSLLIKKERIFYLFFCFFR